MSIKSEKGVAMLLLLALLPVLISLMALASRLSIVQIEHSRLLHICRETALSLQAEHAYNLEKLMSLNPRAAELERKWQRGLKQLARTPSPAAAAVAAYLASIKVKKILLAQKQSIYISKSSVFAKQQNFRLKTRIYNSDTQFAKGISVTNKNNHSGLAILPKYPAIAPEYVERPLFEKSQSVVFKINTQEKASLTCGATLKKRPTTKKYDVTLYRDRF